MPSLLPIDVVAIEEDGFHLMLTAEVNGIPARLLIDTGASRSVFDANRLHRFFDEAPELAENEQKSTGLGTRNMESQALYLEEFRIGELSIKKYPAVVLDMSHVNASYEDLGLEPIDGVLGSDIMMKYGVKIDYRNRSMKINKRRVSLRGPKK